MQMLLWNSKVGCGELVRIFFVVSTAFGRDAGALWLTLRPTFAASLAFWWLRCDAHTMNAGGDRLRGGSG
jgi:hypothetical protein